LRGEIVDLILSECQRQISKTNFHHNLCLPSDDIASLRAGLFNTPKAPVVGN